MKLSKSVTRVTPFSRSLGFALFILFPLVSFLIGIKYQTAIDRAVITPITQPRNPLGAISSIPIISSPPIQEGQNVHITTISPSSGTTGSTVTITGSGFTPSENYILFTGYIGPLNSSDGKTLTFTIPEKMTISCIKPFDTKGAHCMLEAIIQTQLKSYDLQVITKNGTSNKQHFTVIQ